MEVRVVARRRQELIPKVAILIGGSEVKISDSEVKDRFSTMRLVGLS